MRKRLLSLLLVACMVLPLVPVMVIPATAANAGFTTTFERGNENWPTFNLPAADGSTTYEWDGYSLDGLSYGTNSSVATPTWADTWVIGSKPVTVNADKTVTVGSAFNPYDRLALTSSSDVNIGDSTGAWGSTSASGGGVFLRGGLNNVWTAGVNYSGSGNDRTYNTYKSTSALRYKVPNTGVISIDLETAFYATNGIYLAILHNGVEIERVVNDNSAEHNLYYYGETGWVKNDDYTVKAYDGVVVDLAVAQGDTIEFVVVANVKFDINNYTEVGVGSFVYDYGKRGPKDLSVSITWEDGWTYQHIDSWNSDVPVNVISSDKANKLSFYRWYDANDNGKEHMATGIDGEGYYGKINPYLMQESTANILATDTLEQAFEKYCAYFKKTNMIDYSGNWSIVEINKDHTETSPIMYGGWFSMKNIYSVGKSSSGLVRVDICDTQAWVSEKQLDAMFADLWNDMVDFEKTHNVRTGTTAGDIRVKAVAEMSTLQCLAFHVNSGATLGSGDAMSNPFWLRPNNAYNKGGAGALVWTAPEAGVVSLNIKNMNFVHDHGNKDFKYALMLNDVFLIEPTVIDAGSEDSINAMKEAVAAEEALVAAGDQLKIVIYRSDAGKCTRVKFNVSASLNPDRVGVKYVRGDEILATYIVDKGAAFPQLQGYPDFGAAGYVIDGVYATELPETVTGAITVSDYYINTYASMEIADRYAINLYVEADSDALEAGVYVNNQKITGRKQANGLWKVTVCNVNARDLLTAKATFQAYQMYADGYRLSAGSKTVTGVDLINVYLDGNYSDSVKNMATAVRDYAYVADVIFSGAADIPNGNGAPQIKESLKGKYTIAGNYLSGERDVFLATVQQMSIAGYVPSYAGSSFPDSVFVPSPDVTKYDKVEFGYLYETDNKMTALEGDYYFSAVALNHEDRVGFVLKIEGNNGDIADLRVGGKYKVLATPIGSPKQKDFYDAFAYTDSKKDSVSIVINGIPAARYDQDFNFTLVEVTAYDADGKVAAYKEVSATLTYSVEAWAIQTFEFAKASKMGYLASALYWLCQAANDYQG